MEDPSVDLERELREGRDVTVTVPVNRSSGISVLSSPNDTTPTPSGTGASVLDGEEVEEDNSMEEGSRSNNLDLLEETERLLERMNNLSKMNADAVAEIDRRHTSSFETAEGTPGTDLDLDMMLPPPAPTDSLLNVSAETEDSTELNAMLEKAGQLSSMMQSMQSISEQVSLPGESERPISISEQVSLPGESERPISTRSSSIVDTSIIHSITEEVPVKTDNSHDTVNNGNHQNKINGSSGNSNNGKRDPDGNSISDDNNNNNNNINNSKPLLKSPPTAPPPTLAQLTPTTVDDISSYHAPPPKRNAKQDPPGSIATGTAVTKEEEEDDDYEPESKLLDLLDKASVSPDDSSLLKRPTSAVHLPLGMMDDDVSSVGSASFRPYSRQESRSSGHHQPSLLHQQPFSTHQEEEYPPETPNNHNGNNSKDDNDILLGSLGVAPLMPPPPPPPNLDLTQNTESPNSLMMMTPVCSKIPPTDLRADFDVIESSSPRDAKEGAVQWEKVTTAAPGEDDYVPLMDYSHMRPSHNGTTNQESRLERHRKRVQARRKRRKRILAVAVPVLLVIIVFGFLYFRSKATTAKKPSAAEVQVEEVVLPTLFSFDTSLLQDAAADGYSFESEDPSLLVTLPKFVPPPPVVEQEEVKPKKRRGFFGRMMRKQ